MSARKIIGLRGVFDEQLSAVLADESRFAVLLFALKEARPGILEIIHWCVEFLNRVTNEFVALRSKKGKRRWICFETDSAIIKNQNAVEGTIENGLEFALGGVKNAGSLTLF